MIVIWLFQSSTNFQIITGSSKQILCKFQNAIKIFLLTWMQHETNAQITSQSNHSISAHMYLEVTSTDFNGIYSPANDI